MSLQSYPDKTPEGNPNNPENPYSNIATKQDGWSTVLSSQLSSHTRSAGRKTYTYNHIIAPDNSDDYFRQFRSSYMSSVVYQLNS